MEQTNTTATEKPTCMYCRKPIEPGDVEERRIWSPNWRKNDAQSPLRKYHKAKRCGGMDQMAHEG